MSRKIILIIVTVVVVAGGAGAWYMLSQGGLPAGFASGNGRLEATEVAVSAKYAGRLKTVLANEGDTVDAGQVVATIDTQPLEAQLRQAEAQIKEAEDNKRTAIAQVKIKQAELSYAEKQYKRSQDLVSTGAVSERERDLDLAQVDVNRSAVVAANAQAVRAQSAMDAASAEADRLKAEIADNTLKAPIRARVQTRVAEPGEVLNVGGKVLSLVDLSDVYMYVFLPAGTAGKVALGSDARIVLDAIPDYPIRAIVSYVSPTAQFTPKTVETAEERHNLSFRVKLQLDRDRLKQYEAMVKVGIPGVGYVRFNDNAEWPLALQPKTVGELPWKGTRAASSQNAAPSQN